MPNKLLEDIYFFKNDNQYPIPENEEVESKVRLTNGFFRMKIKCWALIKVGLSSARM